MPYHRTGRIGLLFSLPFFGKGVFITDTGGGIRADGEDRRGKNGDRYHRYPSSVSTLDVRDFIRFHPVVIINRRVDDRHGARDNELSVSTIRILITCRG